jgi:molybdopterin-guanine dinucleotide biosynthesis protein
LDLLCFRHAAAEKILLQKQEQLVILSVLKEELSRFSCSTKDLDPLFKNFTIEGFPESKKHLKILYNQQKELFPLLSLPYVVADQQLKLDYQIKVKAAVEVLLSALKVAYLTSVLLVLHATSPVCSSEATRSRTAVTPFPPL